MRTDSADEVKHFRFVALWARRRAYAMDTRARASKLTRNARCVNRFAAKSDDSSRAVANTCARALADCDAACEERADATQKEFFFERHIDALSARVHARSRAFTRVHARSRVGSARLHARILHGVRYARMRVDARSDDGASVIASRTRHASLDA